MNVQRWLVRQEPQWSELEALLNRAEKRGVKTLSADEICQLSRLYRMVSADLARAKTRQVGPSIIDYLQGLTLRSYSQVYQGRKRQDWRAIVEFFQYGFPRVVQDTWLYTVVAIAIFIISGAIAWWYSWQDSEFMALVVPPDLIDLVQNEGKLWMGSIVGLEPLASSGIMTNNISVTFATLAGGIFGGLGTIYILWYNGLLIGAISALVSQNDLAYPFWAFVFPHGSLELPAIFLAGAAGLLLGQSILFPGRYKRLTSLKRQGALAIQLMFGVVPLLIIAGVIEGFLSPNPNVPDAVKYVVGLGILAALGLYLFWPLPKSRFP
ncbi:stage II sporulation protein M [Candidatus Synechococcus calcipolaris G9]|uniref:Stage II sporulation protein M n=1 Tax=Candidatus Synechococcus calcipolaris G9 TaxID=1497997 RepID=A0ABT6EYD8_9SYNE|nr:stage II sporulation protein M [Candidatus Synechococcus calcipolaris]MDG2989900.1 stage II sporulation protein M [Candidatus Synechococcus calcipolaris G9]